MSLCPWAVTFRSASRGIFSPLGWAGRLEGVELGIFLALLRRLESAGVGYFPSLGQLDSEKTISLEREPH